MGLYGLPALQKGQIRLLRVQSKGHPEKINCVISTHSLDDASTPAFSALSYTWGPCHRTSSPEPRPAKHLKVICNDGEVEVTENLHDFMCHFASSQNATLHGYLWIDALCIDQASESERSHQVNLMGKVYMAAAQVVVWLGPEDDSTKAAIDLIKGLFSLPPETRLKLNWHAVSSNHQDPLRNLKNWKALSRFFSRTWFSRAWIIQEAVFAQDCTVLCGSSVLEWECLVRTSQYLTTTSWTTFLKDLNQLQDIKEHWHTTPARLAAAKVSWEGSLQESLLYAFIRARPSACQDPRDKVYSQLGLGHSDLFPDYKRSVTDVYIAAAKHILEHSKSMLLLTCVEGEEFQTSAYKLPSWVPDWSVTKFMGLRITGYRHFNAAGQRPPRHAISISDDNDILSVEAFKLDEIAETCENKEDLRRNLSSSNFWHLISRLRTTHTTLHGDQSRGEAVWRTLSTNRESTPPDQRITYPASPLRLESSFRSWIFWRYVVAAKNPTTYPSPSANDSSLPTRKELDGVWDKIANDRTYFATLAHEASAFDLHYSHAMLQRPFRTEQGYFGIGTQCLREGDSVWIVSGCRVPIILRRVDGSKNYRLVGGSYTHGFMDGEALNREDVKFEMVSLE